MLIQKLGLMLGLRRRFILGGLSKAEILIRAGSFIRVLKLHLHDPLICVYLFVGDNLMTVAYTKRIIAFAFVMSLEDTPSLLCVSSTLQS